VERFRGDTIQTLQFYREADGAFILAATMAIKKEGVVILHSRKDILGQGTMDSVPQQAGDRGFVCAVLGANYLGTEFVITDRAKSTLAMKKNVAESLTGSDRRNERHAESSVHREVGLITYQPLVFTSMPFTLSATVRLNPMLEGHETEETDAPIKELLKKAQTVRVTEDRSLFERFTKRSEMGYMSVGADDETMIATFDSKKPEWSAELNSWTLDFVCHFLLFFYSTFCLCPTQLTPRCAFLEKK